MSGTVYYAIGDVHGMAQSLVALHALIREDHRRRGGKATISVRRAFLYYTLKRLGLDTDPAARRPQDQQIVLLNRERIAALLERAGRAE